MDVKIKGNVKHNGKQYGPGDELKRIKEEEGQRLIHLSVAEEIQTKQEKK